MELSIIIPVHNGGDDFSLCLEALKASEKTPFEIIVVNDASTDDSIQNANRIGARVINLEKVPQGPAVARNRGAALARGDVLVFIDADVAIHTDTLALITENLERNPNISAVIGSYDNSPSKRGYVSLYKNLEHHYVHQHSQREASTFWAGCGAIYRDVFLKIGGFNERYIRPSIEDIELGMRLRSTGYLIQLCPELQVKHLKCWSIFTLLHSDITDRAIPWSRLLLSSSHIPSDLNLDNKSRFSAIAVWVLLISLALGFYHSLFWLLSLFSGLSILFLNFGLYKLFFKQEGSLFLFAAIILHWLYYLYSSFIFVILFVHKFIKSLGNRGRSISIEL